MLIRTQDKRKVINLDNVISIYSEILNPNKVIQEKYTTTILFHTEKLCGDLGTYSSEEKALEVLDMIGQAYISANYNYVHNTVFNMPADDEVNV